jgi:hypothetical protein
MLGPVRDSYREKLERSRVVAKVEGAVDRIEHATPAALMSRSRLMMTRSSSRCIFSDRDQPLQLGEDDLRVEDSADLQDRADGCFQRPAQLDQVVDHLPKASELAGVPWQFARAHFLPF